METTVFEIDLTDGSKFRVFCQNAAQKRRFILSAGKLKLITKEIRFLTNGIHTVSQWERIVETFKIN